MGAKKPSMVRTTFKTCIHPWAESLESTRLCKSCLLEPLSGPDHCDSKAKALYAHKQASETYQDAA